MKYYTVDKFGLPRIFQSKLSILRSNYRGSALVNNLCYLHKCRVAHDNLIVSNIIFVRISDYEVYYLD